MTRSRSRPSLPLVLVPRCQGPSDLVIFADGDAADGRLSTPLSLSIVLVLSLALWGGIAVTVSALV
jgi:hypothetical protein